MSGGTQCNMRAVSVRLSSKRIYLGDIRFPAQRVHGGVEGGGVSALLCDTYIELVYNMRHKVSNKCDHNPVYQVYSVMAKHLPLLRRFLPL